MSGNCSLCQLAAEIPAMSLSIGASSKLAGTRTSKPFGKCLLPVTIVACSDGFTDQPEVINGASDLLVQVFGDAGRHARFAVGTNALPRNVPVEVDAIFEIS